MKKLKNKKPTAGKKAVTDKKLLKPFRIIKGFNTKDGKRFDVGKVKPNFVFEKDFAEKEWKSLLEMEAITPETLGDKK